MEDDSIMIKSVSRSPQKRRNCDLTPEHPHAKRFKTEMDSRPRQLSMPCPSESSDVLIESEVTPGFSRSDENIPVLVDPVSDTSAAGSSPKTDDNNNTIEQCMRTIYKQFTQDVRANDVAPHFLEQEIIQADDMEAIVEEKRPRRRSDILIKAIVNSERAKEFGTLWTIIACLKRAKYTHIADLLERANSFKETRTPVGKCQYSADHAKKALLMIVPVLEKELEPREVIDDLLLCGMLSFKDHEDILTTDNRIKRVKSLLMYLIVDIERNFQLLLDVLSAKKTYFHLVTKFRDRRWLDKKADTDLPTGLKLDLTLKEVLPPFQGNASEITMTVKFNGQSQTVVREVERDIVRRINGHPGSKLHRTMMKECITGVKNLSIRCVRIELEALSPDSLQMLQKACADGNETSVIQNILNSMLTEENIRRLEEAGNTEVKVEISALKPGRATLKCQKVLTKNQIVAHFSVLAKKMPRAKGFIRTFLSKMDRDATYRQEMLDVQSSAEEDQNDVFLKALLHCPDKYLCLLEKELARMDRYDIIHEILELDKDKQMQLKIRKEVIKENYDYLLDELEAGDFTKIFSESEDEDKKTHERIMLEQTREARNRLLLDFLILHPQKSLRRFVKEAEKQRLDFVLDLFKTGQETDEGQIRRKVLQNFQLIVEEIEVSRMRRTFLGRKIFTPDEFDKMCETSVSREDIAEEFLCRLIDKGEEALRCLMSAMHLAGYTNVVQAIETTRDGYSCCVCFLDEEQIKRRRRTVICSAEFDITFAKGKQCDSDLKIHLKRLLHDNESKHLAEKNTTLAREQHVDKETYVKTWLESNNQQEIIDLTSPASSYGECSTEENSFSKLSPSGFSTNCRGSELNMPFSAGISLPPSRYYEIDHAGCSNLPSLSSDDLMPSPISCKILSRTRSPKATSPRLISPCSSGFVSMSSRTSSKYATRKASERIQSSPETN